MKSASALLKKGIIFLQAYSETEEGLSIAYGPVFRAAAENEEEIADCVRNALEHSIQGVPHPTREGWKEVQRPMLEAVGAKSWVALAKGAKSIGIELVSGTVTLLPSADYGNEGGHDLPDQAIAIDLESGELGRMVINAFKVSSA
jgi:hypothetical protein